MSDMIQLKNVSKWYGSFQVLNDCSTSIAKGEVVVVDGNFAFRITEIDTRAARIRSLA